MGFGGMFKIPMIARCCWLMPVILAAQKEEIRSIMVQTHPRKILCETLSQKYLTQKRAGGVAHVVSPESKPQYQKKKKRMITCQGHKALERCQQCSIS
jgi:hypothetical protein